VARERVAYLEMRNRRRLGTDLPTSEHKVSMTVDLDPNPEVLWAAFKTDHRRDIRRAAKNGLTVGCGGAELLDPFYAVMSESWRDIGTPIYAKSYFRRIIEEFPGAIRICLVSAGDEPAAAAFYGLHGKTAEGMWLGSRMKFRKQMAAYLLYWETIKDTCERGLERYHLGRSSNDSGGESHKRKWNAYTTQLYWQYILGTKRQMPALNVDNPRYRLAIAAWRKLPIAATQRLGPFIAGSIP
jgi:FemAB-related protein (PEP-CTERM system-associated)